MVSCHAFFLHTESYPAILDQFWVSWRYWLSRTIWTLYRPRGVWEMIYVGPCSNYLRDAKKHLPDWLWPVLLCELNVCEACPARGGRWLGTWPNSTLTFSYFQGPGTWSSFTVFKNSLPPAFSKALPVKDNSGLILHCLFPKPLVHWLTVLLRLKCLESSNQHTIKSWLPGFPGGPALKNLPAKAGDKGSIPGPGRPHAAWQPNPWAATTERCSRAGELLLLKPASGTCALWQSHTVGPLCAPAEIWPPLSTTKQHAATKT